MSYKDIINSIADMAERSMMINDNDYEKDGLMHCGDCNTPKQSRVLIMSVGVDRVVSCLCKCQSEKHDAEKKEQKRKARFDYLRRLREHTLQEENLKVDRFELDKGYCAKQTELIKRYLSKIKRPVKENRGLLFFGNVGSGKTFLTGCIANWLFDNDYTVMYTSLNKIIKSLQGFKIEDKVEYINEICNYDFMILEDFGTERRTEFANEIIFDVINARYLNKKPLIINTNIPIVKFDNPADIEEERIYDRILQMCVPVKFESAGIRKKISSDINSEFMQEMKNTSINYDDLDNF